MLIQTSPILCRSTMPHILSQIFSKEGNINMKCMYSHQQIVTLISKKETNIPSPRKRFKRLWFHSQLSWKHNVKLFNPPNSLFPYIRSGAFTVLLPQEFTKDKNLSITASVLQQPVLLLYLRTWVDTWTDKDLCNIFTRKQQLHISSGNQKVLLQGCEIPPRNKTSLLATLNT